MFNPLLRLRAGFLQTVMLTPMLCAPSQFPDDHLKIAVHLGAQNCNSMRQKVDIFFFFKSSQAAVPFLLVSLWSHVEAFSLWKSIHFLC